VLLCLYTSNAVGIVLLHTGQTEEGKYRHVWESSCGADRLCKTRGKFTSQLLPRETFLLQDAQR